MLIYSQKIMGNTAGQKLYNHHFQDPVLILVGPTAIGKTELALQISEEFNCEIIGVDSMQVYKYMDIGTAKPTKIERERVFHHLVDFISPEVNYNATDFVSDCLEAISLIRKKGKTPLLAGGTGLYIQSLLEGIFSMPEIDKNIREYLKEEIETKGSSELYKQLQKLDPATADRIHHNDSYRITRALEIFMSSGVRWSEYIEQHRRNKAMDQSKKNILKIGLNRQRKHLYERINKRVDLMISKGLLDEVHGLLEMGFDNKLKTMQSLGYKHMNNFIQKRWNWQETIDFLARDTRRYAKRQLTWFRNDKEINWFEPSQHKEIFQTIKNFLTTQNNKSLIINEKLTR